MIGAKIIADSKNIFGDRLTSVIGEFPRIVLAEFNTHKMISKNSASSRAIPHEKMMKRLKNDPFYPIRWMINHKGMQGKHFFSYEESIVLRNIWNDHRWVAMEAAEKLNHCSLTKQVTNRLLEPFMWHKVLASATEWQNFFALRNHDEAEIHIAEFARIFMLAYNDSNPTILKPGDWHLPFGDNIDEEQMQSAVGYAMDGSEESEETFLQNCKDWKIKIVGARCARTSYNNFDGDSDYIKDFERHDSLIEQGHWSPLEHPAQSMDEEEYFAHGKSIVVPKEYIDLNEADFKCGKSIVQPNKVKGKFIVFEYGWCGNYRGFTQYRKTFYDENRKDSRVIIK